MSSYSFIASDYEIPEVDNIRKATIYNRYVRLYTDRSPIYSVDFRYTEPRENSW